MSLSRLEQLIKRRDPNGGIDVQVYNKLKDMGSIKVGEYIGMRLMTKQLIDSLNRLKGAKLIDFDGTTATLASQQEGFGWGDPHKKDPKRAFPGARWTVKYNETNTMKKSELKEVIKELLSEMWVDTSVTPEDPKGDEPGLKTTGKLTEPGADAPFVDLYKGGGGGEADTLPSVGGAMSEGKHPLSKYLEGDGTEEDLSKQKTHPKGVNVYEKLKKKVVSEVNVGSGLIPKDKNKVAQLIFGLKEGEYIWFSFDKEGRSNHGYGVEKKVEGDEYVYRTIGPYGEYLEEDEDVEKYAENVVKDPHANYYFIDTIQGYKKAPYEGDPDHDIGDYEINGPDRPSWREMYESLDKKGKLQFLIKEMVSSAIKENGEFEENQEMILFKQIQSAAHWLDKRMEFNELVGRDVIQAIELIKVRIDELVDSHEKMIRRKKQEPLKRRLQYKHGKPVTGMMEGDKKQQENVEPHKVGDKFRFSKLHQGEMEVVKVLGKSKDGKRYKYRVKYPNGEETVISK